MQLWNIDLRPSVLVGALGEMLGTQEGVTIAMALTGDDALILVNVLDQVGKTRTRGTPFDYPGTGPRRTRGAI